MIWNLVDIVIFIVSALLLGGVLIARAIAKKRDPEAFSNTAAEVSDSSETGTSDVENNEQ